MTGSSQLGRKDFLHDNENRRENAGKSNPSQYGQLAQSPDTREQPSGNGSHQRPDDGAAFAVGEYLETLRQADESRPGRQTIESSLSVRFRALPAAGAGLTYIQVSRNKTVVTSRAIGPPISIAASTMLWTPLYLVRNWYMT